jgi:hypothetical protein
MDTSGQIIDEARHAAFGVIYLKLIGLELRD